MVTRRQKSSVVGLIFVTEIIDNWRAVKSIMSATKTRVHRASAHAYPRRKHDLCTFQIGWENVKKTHFNSIFNMGPHF